MIPHPFVSPIRLQHGEDPVWLGGEAGDHRHAWKPITVLVEDGLDDFGLVGDQDLWNQPCRGPRLQRRRQHRQVNTRGNVPMAGKGHRPISPENLAGFDQPTGDQRRASRMVAYRSDKAVVLVPKISGKRGDVTQTGSGRRVRWSGPLGDQAGPCGRHRDRLDDVEGWAKGPANQRVELALRCRAGNSVIVADLPDARPGADVGIEHSRGRPPHPTQPRCRI